MGGFLAEALWGDLQIRSDQADVYVGHLPGNVPLALSKRQSDQRRISAAFLFPICSHGRETRLLM